MSGRTRCELTGGPFHRCLCFPPQGAVELVLERDGQAYFYRIDSGLGIYVGTCPLTSLPTDDKPRGSADN